MFFFCSFLHSGKNSPTAQGKKKSNRFCFVFPLMERIALPGTLIALMPTAPSFKASNTRKASLQRGTENYYFTTTTKLHLHQVLSDTLTRPFGPRNHIPLEISYLHTQAYYVNPLEDLPCHLNTFKDKQRRYQTAN